MARTLNSLGNRTFTSLGVRNFRLYFVGQTISTSGTFMQSIAQAWLVLKLTNSGTALGVVAALQNLPILFLAPWGGVIADRFPKRKLLFLTQSAFGVVALCLGFFVLTGLVRLWMVYLLALAFGLINVVDNPTRQSFVVEMVGEDQLKNAVTLYSSMVNLARIIGPSIAGVLIVTVGLGLCYVLNGLSYAAVVIMLVAMHPDQLHPTPRLALTKGQISAGFRYVASTPVLRDVLIIMAVIGTFTYEFQVSLPLLAEFTFHSNATGYAALSAALGLGAVMGGLASASRKATSFRILTGACFLFGLAALLASLMPSLPLAVAGMVLVGVFSIVFSATGNTILQLHSDPQMRGRVMALWAIAFLGSTTIGGPVIGFIGQTVGPRWGLAAGGLAALAAGLYGVVAAARRPARHPGHVPQRMSVSAERQRKRMDLQSGVFPIQPEEFPRVVEVWEASVRATHDFVSDADIEVFRPLLREELPQIAELACVRASDGQLAGFVGVADGKVEMLFIHPAWRGQGGGARLLHYAVTTFGATTLDVNEQNGAALGFYLRMGFEVVGRSETDGMGKPYPLLHMRLAKAVEQDPINSASSQATAASE